MAMTVMEAVTRCARVALTETLLRVVVANARQISAVPNCTFVRRTRDQVRPAPATALTVMFDEAASVATTASSSSLLVGGDRLVYD
jgi:hypothetical protein